MKIYTKTGDTGQTGLFGGQRVAKDTQRIEAYGTVDELNSVLGQAISDLIEARGKFKTKGLAGLAKEITHIQSDLFVLGAELATPRGKTPPIGLIKMSSIKVLEQSIDRMEKGLKPLRNFILPQGPRAATTLHFARAVSRRAERIIVGLHRSEPLRSEVVIFANRISDWLFVAARFCTKEYRAKETEWKPVRKK